MVLAKVTVVIAPEGGDRGVFGRIGIGWHVGVGCGDTLGWIWVPIAATPTDGIWLMGTKFVGI